VKQLTQRLRWPAYLPGSSRFFREVGPTLAAVPHRPSGATVGVLGWDPIRMAGEVWGEVVWPAHWRFN
jgi:hypothetical protein